MILDWIHLDFDSFNFIKPLEIDLHLAIINLIIYLDYFKIIYSFMQITNFFIVY